MTEDKARFLASIATGSTTYDGFDDCDLVLEAVVEEMAVKQQVFSELREVVGLGLRARDEHVLAVGRPRWAPTSACTSSTRSR